MLFSETAFKTILQRLPWQVAPDEDEPTCAGFVELPRPLTIALEEHVNGLYDETIRVVLES
jgi:hypothetical protein